MILLPCLNSDNNLCRDTYIVAIGNCSTSIFAGFVIYSYIGNLAHELGVGVGDVSQDGKL